MSTRYRKYVPLSRERLKTFVALDNMTAQLPLIEILPDRKHIRIWVSYDPNRVLGTFTEISCNTGLVESKTVYPSGRVVSYIVRPADRKVRHARVEPENNAS